MPKLTICSRICNLAGGEAAKWWLSPRRLGAPLAACLVVVLLTGCGAGSAWHAVDVSGSLPPLSFTMTRTEDGKQVTQADYRGETVLLYFGYTNCPDVCPTTLSEVHDILTRLGPEVRRVRMLFVTVDPNRDTAPVLSAYVKNFGTEIDGLRGTPDELAALARHCRVEYSVTPASGNHPYDVTHSSAIFVFDGSGAARLIVASLSSTTPDVAGTTADLKRLVDEGHPPGLLARLEQWI
jgi:protein SCO1/2